ncbi:MAG: hypothetical protein MI685_00015 [Chlorobiales bacterium]|nr:hypothetical protein [Chlorobiales bacterium]
MSSISIGTTDVNICARALVNIGLKPIDNLDGDDDVTTTCSLKYPEAKEEVLSLYPWYATKGKVRLGRLTSTPVNEYKYAFAMPSNRISGALAIYNSGEQGAYSIKDWDVQGTNILSNEESLWGDFQFDLDESLFPTHIKLLITYALSSKLAEILTDDTSKSQAWSYKAFGAPGAKGMGGYFEIARTIDSRFRPTQSVQGFSLVDVRGS